MDFHPTDEVRTNEAFFEAYFSNFIEGTEFEVEEAVDIVFNGNIPEERPKDAHDILGTYEVVSDRREMVVTPGDFEGFVGLLRRRHARIMAGRLEVLPGVFKSKVNRAGTTTFVKPEDVVGTLREGFRIYQRLGDV